VSFYTILDSWTTLDLGGRGGCLISGVAFSSEPSQAWHGTVREDARRDHDRERHA
jgi:hypothetical protein